MNCVTQMVTIKVLNKKLKTKIIINLKLQLGPIKYFSKINKIIKS